MQLENLITQVPRQRVSIYGNLCFCLLVFIAFVLGGILSSPTLSAIQLLLVIGYIPLYIALDRYNRAQIKWLKKHGSLLQTELNKVSYVFFGVPRGDK